MTDILQPSETEVATLFLRLEGPLQSWGGRTIGRFRRTESIPTKSGVIGLLGAALGLHRGELNQCLDDLNNLMMGVRVDRAGHIEEDYQTVGAKIGVLAADGEIKQSPELKTLYPNRVTYQVGRKESLPDPKSYETIVSPREYLIDASFLVILRGDGELIETLAEAVRNPKWPLFLGRKRCVPGTRIFGGIDNTLTLADAIRRDGPEDQALLAPDKSPSVRVVTDLIGADALGDLIGVDGNDLKRRYERAKLYVTDRLVRLGDPPIQPVHVGRIVLDIEMPRPQSSLDRPDFADSHFGLPGPNRPQRASDPGARKTGRAKSAGRCAFCRFEPADPRDLHAHHLTYGRRGRERVTDDWESTETDDLVMLCCECHAAVSMLEYQSGFGLNRIDPRNARWHARIVAARESRRRHRNRTHPIISAGPRPRIDARGKPLDLIESTIPLNAGSSFAPQSPGNRWLANRHHVHRRLSMAFPDAGGRFAAKGYGVTRDEGGFLYRIESGPVARITVRSRILPDWGRAFAQATWLVKQNVPAPRQLDLTAFDDGTELTFDVETNPVKRLRADGPEGRMGARVPLRDDDALAQWIGRRANNSGFEIMNGSLNIERLGRQTARMTMLPDRHWDGIRFTGRLCVTNAVKIRAALAAGIGPAKAFGFGLLSVAPVQ